jgi:3-methyladenine DNA glycosylase Tag
MQGKPPPRRRPKPLAGYLEALSRPVFQAGMSWRVIDAKRQVGRHPPRVRRL